MGNDVEPWTHGLRLSMQLFQRVDLVHPHFIQMMVLNPTLKVRDVERLFAQTCWSDELDLVELTRKVLSCLFYQPD